MLTSALRRTEAPLTSGTVRQPQRGLVLPLRRNSGFPTRDEPDFSPTTDDFDFAVTISPADLVKRCRVGWNGMAAEIVQVTEHNRIETRFSGPVHLLVLAERGSRHDGETCVEGLPRSSLRDYKRKLTFVPAGHDYVDWQLPRNLARVVYFYLDPAKLPIEPAPTGFAPRLFFENAALWDTAAKLAALIETPAPHNRLYFEALGLVLAHELVRLGQTAPRLDSPVRGGLASWQERTVAAYIEEHLDEQIPLSTLAGLVRLSPFYFCRAFKQSFGLPPHRYHTQRRIERAKALLAKPNPSVTKIGLTVGFSETSSFTAAFRKAMGLTPTAYHRSLF
jgi:AraC family transcriptional regulator